MSVAYAMKGNAAKSDFIIDEIIRKQGASGTLLVGVPNPDPGTNPQPSGDYSLQIVKSVE